MHKHTLTLACKTCIDTNLSKLNVTFAESTELKNILTSLITSLMLYEK